MTARRRLLVLALIAALPLVMVAGGAPAAVAAPQAQRTLAVFAAASLADAFGELARDFERSHPSVAVRLNLAGSHVLATQIDQGAAADVFASADRRWMDFVSEKALLAGADTLFARNRLVVIVPRTNPARIGELRDLARRSVKLVIGAEAVPIGEYSRQTLRNIARLDGFDPSFARRVLANVVSEEENVRSVVGKVQLGEADAGLCYRSDVTPGVARYLRVIEIPDAANVIAAYPIAVLARATEPDLAREFVALVLSPSGQLALERHGLISIATQAP